jgi:hypothetical protein
MMSSAGAGAGTPASVGKPALTTVADVAAALGADVLWCPDPTAAVGGVAAADLMSDVLVDARSDYVLVTGLVNVQVIRTAVIAELAAVVFARGKAVPTDVLELAREMRVPVLAVRSSLFETAGRLYGMLRKRAADTGTG